MCSQIKSIAQIFNCCTHTHIYVCSKKKNPYVSDYLQLLSSEENYHSVCYSQSDSQCGSPPRGWSEELDARGHTLYTSDCTNEKVLSFSLIQFSWHIPLIKSLCTEAFLVFLKLMKIFSCSSVIMPTDNMKTQCNYLFMVLNCFQLQ